jgi:DNA-binding beta-propeller fold protein YncE
MGPGSRSRAAAAVASLLALFAVGCGGGSSNSTASHQSATARGSHPLPVPFTVAARYSPASLGLNEAAGLAIGPDGNLYVSDNSQRVTVISPGGRVLRRWGKPGSGPGEFRFVSDTPDSTAASGAIAVGSNGMVYVSDNGNGRVEVFTPHGQFVRQFGSPGTGSGQFVYPYMLVVDSAGSVYVLDDQQTGVVQKFSPAGNFVWRIGGLASSDPDLASFHHMGSIDSHGRLVMTSDDTGHVIYVDAGGHKVDSFNANRVPFPPGASPCDATVDSVGNTYVTGCGGGSCPTASCANVLVFDRAHRMIAAYPSARLRLFSAPLFGPDGEAFALGQDRSLIRLRVTLPGG